MPDRDDLSAISSFCGISTAHCCVNCHRCTTTMTDKVYRIRTTRRALHCLCLYRKKIFSYIKSAVRLECKFFWEKLSVPQKKELSTRRVLFLLYSSVTLTLNYSASEPSVPSEPPSVVSSVFFSVVSVVSSVEFNLSLLLISGLL